MAASYLPRLLKIQAIIPFSYFNFWLYTSSSHHRFWSDSSRWGETKWIYFPHRRHWGELIVAKVHFARTLFHSPTLLSRHSLEDFLRSPAFACHICSKAYMDIYVYTYMWWKDWILSWALLARMCRQQYNIQWILKFRANWGNLAVDELNDKFVNSETRLLMKRT